MLESEVALARHLPTARIYSYDEDTCDVRGDDGTAHVELRDPFTGEVIGSFPRNDVAILTMLR